MNNEPKQPACHEDIVRLDLKIDMKTDELRDHMDVLIENAVGDIVAAFKDKQSLTDDKLEDHEKRISALEDPY